MTSLTSFSVTSDFGSSNEAPCPSSLSTSKRAEPAWSWVVLIGSFLCLCVLDGISYTFGMLLGPLMEALQCDRSGFEKDFFETMSNVGHMQLIFLLHYVGRPASIDDCTKIVTYKP